MTTKGIGLKDVSFGYQDNGWQLTNINLYILPGAFCGIVGANGSGKSTLTFLLNGLIPHEIRGNLEGEIFIDGVNTRTKSVADIARSVGILFQNPDYMLFNLTVAEEIEFGLKNLKLDDRPNRIAKALSTVGLSGFEKRDPQSLSLGQKQKLALACVLALETKYIVLDEPAAMLDYQSTRHLYETLVKINKSGKTIIVVEHDTDYLLEFADQAVILNNGKIVYSGSPRFVFSHKKEIAKLGLKIPHDSK